MTKEDELNKELDAIMAEVLDSSLKYSTTIENKLNDVRKQVNGLLLEYSNKDKTISYTRLNTLLRELDDVEASLVDELETSVDKYVEDTSKKSNKALIAAITAAVGVGIAFGGKDRVPTLEQATKETVEYIKGEKADGLDLNDRIRRLSGSFRDDMQKAIRYGVMSKYSINKISRNVKEAFDKGMWQIKTIVTSELPTVVRKSMVWIAGKTNIVKWVKIIDNRGRHKYHTSHQCYIYAEQNKYGVGKGIFKPTDTYILDPHPQCTAYFHYIFKDDIEGMDDTDA